AFSLPILFKRQVPLTDKDNNPKDDDDEKEAENDNDDVEILLSSLNICSGNDDDCLLSTVVEDVNIPLPAHLKLQHSSELTIAGHCDGIICLKLFIGNVILCNPAMQEFKLIPKSSLVLPEDVELWPGYLEYGLRYYTDYLGFGYDPKSEDYKIIRMVNYDKEYYWSRAEVYTMKSNSWREIEILYDYERMHHIDSWPSFLPIYFNGICYWRVISDDLILSFDMGSELFHEIPMPDLADGCKNRAQLAVWKEFIALFNFHDEIGVAHQSYDMWVMMDDLGEGGKGSWTKYLTIGPLEGVQSPVIFWKSDQLLMVTNDGQIVVHNIGTKKLKHLPIHLIRSLYSYHDQALVYVNSIASINGGNVLEDINISAFYGSGKFYSNREVDISGFYSM
uniref:F-box/kelch-repeat protein At3g06240-like n=1 Tax=Fragaria vesca subsp. vesca TaxID=101020 RepID=UPI0005CB5632